MDGVSNITRRGRGKNILVTFPFLHWFPRHTLTLSLGPSSSFSRVRRALSVSGGGDWAASAAALRQDPRLHIPYARFPGCTLLFPCCCGRPSTQRREPKLFELGSNLIQLIASVVHIYFAYKVFFLTFLAKKEGIGPFG